MTNEVKGYHRGFIKISIKTDTYENKAVEPRHLGCNDFSR